jgi:hypothetical protein
MRRRAIITTPFATPQETARLYGVPKRRANEIIRMVEESLAKKGYLVAYYKKSSAGSNGASSLASHSYATKVKAKGIKTSKSKPAKASRRKLTRAKTKSAH